MKESKMHLFGIVGFLALSAFALILYLNEKTGTNLFWLFFSLAGIVLQTIAYFQVNKIK
jgi:hypothetical protein